VIAKVVDASGQVADQPEQHVHRGALHVPPLNKNIHSPVVTDSNRPTASSTVSFASTSHAPSSSRPNSKLASESEESLARRSELSDARQRFGKLIRHVGS
jgi:hypothetical protein